MSFMLKLTTVEYVNFIDLVVLNNSSHVWLVKCQGTNMDGLREQLLSLNCFTSNIKDLAFNICITGNKIILQGIVNIF